jgi:hypothetical protein
MLFQYEGTFMFDAVIPDLPIDLPRGQVIVRGVALFDVNFDPLKPLTFAIVGGTGAYEGASGQAIHSGPGRQYPHAQDRVVTARDSVSHVCLGGPTRQSKTRS